MQWREDSSTARRNRPNRNASLSHVPKQQFAGDAACLVDKSLPAGPGPKARKVPGSVQMRCFRPRDRIDSTAKYLCFKSDVFTFAVCRRIAVACFLRNTLAKTAKPACDLGCSSLRVGTEGLRCRCDGGGNPKSTRPINSLYDRSRVWGTKGTFQGCEAPGGHGTLPRQQLEV